MQNKKMSRFLRLLKQLFFFELNNLFPLNQVVNYLGQIIKLLEKSSNRICSMNQKLAYLDYIPRDKFV